mmetsp:Transcript_8017/g.21695  ORF Transcript_8017/g.21695 Transcript_8017/m.21695 type:complete len:82 (+) Transcript_8017:167-412(+)
MINQVSYRQRMDTTNQQGWVIVVALLQLLIGLKCTCSCEPQQWRGRQKKRWTTSQDSQNGIRDVRQHRGRGTRSIMLASAT